MENRMESSATSPLTPELPPELPLGPGPSEGGASRLRAMVSTLRYIATPLLIAMAEVRAAMVAKGQAPASDAAGEAQTFHQLVNAAVGMARAAAEQMGASEAPTDDWARWQIAAAAAQMVASHYKATGKAMPNPDAQAIVKAINEARQSFRGPAAQMPESMPNTIGNFRARMLETLVPVVGAVSQYAFNRQEHALLGDVTERILKSADQATRALAPPGLTAEEWRVLSWHVLKSAGQIYAEAHYAEADRLLYLPEADRNAYFAAHNNLPPLDRLWDNFDLRLSMLVTLAAYVDVPATAALDAPVWE